MAALLDKADCPLLGQARRNQTFIQAGLSFTSCSSYGADERGPLNAGNVVVASSPIWRAVQYGQDCSTGIARNLIV